MLLIYDIRPGVQESYYRYLMQELVPALYEQRLYLQAAWHTIYGEYPSRQVEFITDDRQILVDLIKSPDWHEREDRLQEYTRRYSRRIVTYRGGFHIVT